MFVFNDVFVLFDASNSMILISARVCVCFSAFPFLRAEFLDDGLLTLGGAFHALLFHATTSGFENPLSPLKSLRDVCIITF